MATSPKVGDKLATKLSKPFAPDTRIDDEFKGNDLTIFTNDNGDAMVLFIGERRPDGSIKGDRFARRLVRDENGKTVKNHWDYKGRV